MSVKTFIKNQVFCTLLFCVFVVTPVIANEEKDTHTTEEASTSHKKEKFNPKEFIFEHIQDAHEWHMGEFRGTPISVPLPIIVYSKTSGLHVFMSSNFHHGHASYLGFNLILEGQYKGKITETDASGNISLPIDISITKDVLSLFLGLALMLWVFLGIAARYKQNAFRAPKGKQSLFEPIIIFIRDDIAKASIGEKKYERFMPYLLTVFFFIWFNNMMGLIPIFPGGANLTGNISVTLILALFTFVITTINSNKYYWEEIYNAPGVPWWLKFPIPLMPLVEFMGVLTKPFTLMVRLFANITAGHIIALAFFGLIFIFGEINPIAGYGTSLLSVAFTIFMSMLEILVALIQAYVFTLLSALYFGMATAEHHH